MDVTNIISAIITLISAIIVTILIPYFKAKTTAQTQNNLMIIIKAAVLAAEQIFKGTGLGKEKKEYVLQYLKDKGIKIDTNSVLKDVDNMIESVVYEMNKEKAVE